jgi:hypothetical protein
MARGPRPPVERAGTGIRHPPARLDGSSRHGGDHRGTLPAAAMAARYAAHDSGEYPRTAPADQL